ncbi:MAG: hypothetical protein M3Q96_07300 [Pseudomonadota bacterium]|nr:hypothetical protein [Pseudomonadota bacterium]
MARRSRSRGIRQPVRNAVLCSLLTGVGIALVVLGVLDMRATGNTGSPLLALGLLPALLAPIALIHALMHVKVFRDLRSGRTVTARWTVSADEFKRFCEADRRNPASSVMTNFYKPPPSIPADGVEVVFSDTGVMIGDGYFPLSATRGRRLEGVREVVSDPPSIESRRHSRASCAHPARPMSRPAQCISCACRYRRMPSGKPLRWCAATRQSSTTVEEQRTA